MQAWVYSVHTCLLYIYDVCREDNVHLFETLHCSLNLDNYRLQAEGLIPACIERFYQPSPESLCMKSESDNRIRRIHVKFADLDTGVRHS